MAWRFPPTRDTRGVLSLGILPTPEEWRYCGFDFHILFGAPNYPYLDFVKATGATVIPYCNKGDYGAWGDESQVGGYYLADDTVYDVEAVRGWYNKMKQKTSKPVGSIFWRPPHDADRNRLISISNFLDFILPYDYPYRDGRSLEATNSYIAYMINLAKDLKCPAILGAQAMDDDFEKMADPGQVGVRNQYQQYYNAGISVWWYSWTNLVTDVKRNYQNLMHEFYGGVAPLPYPCPYCSERFPTQAELDAHIASEHPTPVFTCPQCGDTFDSQPELDDHIATVHPEPDLEKLRQELAILEEKVKQLKEQIQVAREKIKSIKALLGEE